MELLHVIECVIPCDLLEWGEVLANHNAHFTERDIDSLTKNLINFITKKHLLGISPFP